MHIEMHGEKLRFESASVKSLYETHIRNLGDPSTINVKTITQEHFDETRPKCSSNQYGFFMSSRTCSLSTVQHIHINAKNRESGGLSLGRQISAFVCSLLGYRNENVCECSQGVGIQHRSTTVTMKRSLINVSMKSIMHVTIHTRGTLVTGSGRTTQKTVNMDQDCVHLSSHTFYSRKLLFDTYKSMVFDWEFAMPTPPPNRTRLPTVRVGSCINSWVIGMSLGKKNYFMKVMFRRIR